jgi:transcriptional regulator with XRE-family HTH domain
MPLTPNDRQHAVEAFRRRVLELIDRAGESRSAFAVRVGMDRSTLSQLLSEDNERLPRAETVMAIAAVGQVSCDWLLGLTQDEHEGTELIRADTEIESGAASPLDERLMRWHRDARGYKIRYVPTTLPDLLKTEAVIRYECPDLQMTSPETGVAQSAYQLSYSRDPDTEMEVCCPAQTLVSFARGEGVWAGLEPAERRAQLERMARLSDELYPTFRWSLYDGQRHFSAPVTLFGSQRAVLYVGDLYFVFNTTEHIRVLASHFDGLVKVAKVQPTGIPGFLSGLLGEIPD